jgi:hypothetical protein
MRKQFGSNGKANAARSLKGTNNIKKKYTQIYAKRDKMGVKEKEKGRKRTTTINSGGTQM